ncbi:MAG: hypothetical protein ABSF29_13120 [Tepidisphaeraceae bacterium]|jgi:hypothetical protein
MLKQMKRIFFAATDEESGASYDLVAEGEVDTETESHEGPWACCIQTATGQSVRAITKGRYQIEGVFGPIDLSSDDPNAP